MSQTKSRLLNGRQNRYFYPLPSTANPTPSEKDTLPRMTRILSMKDKPKLREWYARMAANQAVHVTKGAMAFVGTEVEGGRSTADAIKAATEAGIAPDMWVETKTTRLGAEYQKEVGNAAWDTLSTAANRTFRKAGNIGTAVHKYPEYVYADGMSPQDAIDKLVQLNPDAREAIQKPELWFEPLDAFFQDQVEEVVYAERALYNPELKYAGTTDMIVTINGEAVILDFKTGSAGNFNDVGTQLAGYSLCTEVEPDPTERDSEGTGILWDDPMLPMPEIAYGLCVHVLGNGTVDIKRTDVHGTLRDMFVGLVAVYHNDLANANDKWIVETTSYNSKGVVN